MNKEKGIYVQSKINRRKVEMNKLTSIIILASDNADTLTNVIASASNISPHEIIVLIKMEN
jgi:hypothetical protein